MHYRLFLSCIVYLCTVTVILTDAAGAGQVMTLKEATKHLGKDGRGERLGPPIGFNGINNCPQKKQKSGQE